MTMLEGGGGLVVSPQKKNFFAAFLRLGWSMQSTEAMLWYSRKNI